MATKLFKIVGRLPVPVTSSESIGSAKAFTLAQASKRLKWPRKALEALYDAAGHSEPARQQAPQGTLRFHPQLMDSFWPAESTRDTFAVRIQEPDCVGAWLFTVQMNPAFDVKTFNSFMWLICMAPEMFRLLRELAVHLHFDADNMGLLNDVLRVLYEANAGSWAMSTLQIPEDSDERLKKHNADTVEKLKAAGEP